MEHTPISIGRYTDAGPRFINEDAIFVLRFPPNHISEVVAILGVADGMGGLKKGQEVSYSVLDILQSNLTDRIYSIKEATREKIIELLQDAIEDIFDLANKEILKIFKETSSDRASAGCTLTIAIVLKGSLIIGHVGDSRAYLLKKDRRFIQLTEDQSVGKRLLNRLGMKNMVVQKIVSRIEEGEAVIICTDGVTDFLSSEEMKNIILTTSSIQAACNKIIFRAKECGTTDNCSVVALEYGKLVRKPITVDNLDEEKALINNYKRYKGEKIKTPFWRKMAYLTISLLAMLFLFLTLRSLLEIKSETQRSITTQEERQPNLPGTSKPPQSHEDQGSESGKLITNSAVDQHGSTIQTSNKLQTVNLSNQLFWIKVDEGEPKRINITEKDYITVIVPYLPENASFGIFDGNGDKIGDAKFIDMIRDKKEDLTRLKISLKPLKENMEKGSEDEKKFLIKEYKTNKSTITLSAFKPKPKIERSIETGEEMQRLLEEFKKSVKIEITGKGFLRDQDIVKLSWDSDLLNKLGKRIDKKICSVVDERNNFVIEEKEIDIENNHGFNFTNKERSLLKIYNNYKLKILFKIGDETVESSLVEFTYAGSVNLKEPKDKKEISPPLYFEWEPYPAQEQVEYYQVKIASSKEFLNKSAPYVFIGDPIFPPKTKYKIDNISDLRKACGDQERYCWRVSAKLKPGIWVFSEDREFILKTKEKKKNF